MFLYLSRGLGEYDIREADLVVIGVPFSSTSIGRESKFGPTVIRHGIKQIESFDLEIGVDIQKKWHICDLGDLDVVPGSFSKTADRLKKTIKDIQRENPKAKFCFFGGEHSITLPIIETLKPKTIVQLDAHRDLDKEYKGKKFAHGTWAFYASKFAELRQIGVRSSTEEEEANANKLNIKEDLNGLKEPVYLTLDIDVLDPVYAETGLPEMDGLTPEELFAIIKKVCKNKIVGFDIVELSATDLNSKSSVMAATIFRKVLSLI